MVVIFSVLPSYPHTFVLCGGLAAQFYPAVTVVFSLNELDQIDDET